MSTLTNREREVISLLAQGKSQIRIARELNVTKWTVHYHVRNIREKTGASSALDLAVKAAMAMQR